MYGYRIFDEIVDIENKIEEDKILYLTNNKIQYAKGIITDEGFVILKGSRIKEGISTSISPSLLNFAERERDSNDIINGEFVRNHLCSSPSMAGVVILGRNCNGYDEWKNENGKKLRDIVGE